MSGLIARLQQALNSGVVLREEPFGRLSEVDPETALRLREFLPVVALHRSGNELTRIDTAVRAGVLVETDVQVHDGRFVAEHEHRAGPLSYDWQRRLWRLGDPPFSLEPVLAEAKRLDAGLLLDLKLTTDWVPALIGLVRRYGLIENAAFTGEWRPLDAIHDYGVTTTAGFNYGGMNRGWKLERFLREQPRMKRPGVSLHKKLASRENIERLHGTGAQVLVYVVSDGAEALELLRHGADGLVTNNVALAEVWRAPKTQLSSTGP
ncbi:MAG TPA: hypothetical protein VH951_03580 [Dehalococcoidia bacterium]